MKRKPDDLDALVDEALRRTGPATACALASWIRCRGNRMTEVQVYRSLRRLMAGRYARHICLGRRYARRAPRDADVLAAACRRCNRLQLIPQPAAHLQLRKLAAANNFKVDESIVEVLGTCSVCEGEDRGGH